MRWVDYITAGGFLLTGIAASLAYLQLRESKGLARGQFILALDQLLAPFEEVRRQINQGRLPKDEVELRRYIAAFERIGLLLKDDHLKLDTVNQFYGGRFARLVKSNAGANVRIVTDSPGEWRAFVWLWTKLQVPRQLDEPPSLTQH